MEAHTLYDTLFVHRRATSACVCVVSACCALSIHATLTLEIDLALASFIRLMSMRPLRSTVRLLASVKAPAVLTMLALSSVVDRCHVSD